jgi:3-oxoacyl-[acyl-carrier protein] reductase
MHDRFASQRDLQGTVVLVTGASKGLGRAMAIGLAGAGADVILSARASSLQLLESVKAEIVAAGSPGSTDIATCDVGDPDDCARVADRAIRRFGRIDVLVNNAGLGMNVVGPNISRELSFVDVDVSAWRRIVDTNINGVFYMTRACVPTMVRSGWGRIVNVTTSTATMTRKGFAPYGPAKAAVEAFTAICAMELRGSGVTVNALLPGGPADTGMILADDVPDRASLLRPETMVPPVLCLASRLSDGFTGRRVVAREWDAGLDPVDALRRASTDLP